MSQEQPRRPQEGQEPIKYGDVFSVTGELADKAIAPGDAALMQTAETRVLGQTQRGGPAAAMQSAATMNERAGHVSHTGVTNVAGQRGVTVTETDLPGQRIITEAVAGQVLRQVVQPTPEVNQAAREGGFGQERGGYGQQARAGAGGHDNRQEGYSPTAGITIGEALEATALTAGNKPVEQSDAAAIQAAEVRATGSNVITPGGVAATAQSAASYNEAGLLRDEDKIKLGHVLTDATMKLPADKSATREDAEGVVAAELRNNPNLATHPGGISASVAAAARLNEKQSS